VCGLAGREAIVPGHSHQAPAGMTITGFGDAASLAPPTGGILVRYQAQETHQLDRHPEAANVPEFGEQDRRLHLVDLSHRHEGFDHRAQGPACQSVLHLLG